VQGEGAHPSLERKHKLERKGRRSAQARARKTGETVCAARSGQRPFHVFCQQLGAGESALHPMRVFWSEFLIDGQGKPVAQGEAIAKQGDFAALCVKCCQSKPRCSFGWIDASESEGEHC
jgi:hypothetical protein